MIKALVFAHVALFVGSVIIDRRRGVQRLRNLAVPVGIGFFYTSVVQAWAAAGNLGRFLTLDDIQMALWVSLSCYLAFLVWYEPRARIKARYPLSEVNLDLALLNGLAMLFFVAGVLGYYLNIRTVGSIRAYLGMAEWESYLYQVSGYIYMLKYAIFAAVGLWLVSYALNGLPKWMHWLLVPVMFGLLFEAVQTTDRGDTIRASLMIVAWVYFLSRRPGRHKFFVSLGNAVIVAILALLTGAVLLLPEFRGPGRSLLQSEVTLLEAIERASGKEGSSRLSREGGGEFDSAARIINRVNAGEITHPGPVHIARLFWNVVPRTLVPEKWELFNNWAGQDWQEILVGSSSYYGCAITGWGEAYGCIGWLGALLYWAAFGYVVRRYEDWIGAAKVGLVVSVISYLPLLDYVIMTFWAASMALCTVVVPFLFVMKLCERKLSGRPVRRRRTRGSIDIQKSQMSGQQERI